MFKQKITELKDKLDEKDKIIAFKNETVNNLEVELGMCDIYSLTLK